MTTTTFNVAPASRGANIGIWAAQVIGAALFIMSGTMKLVHANPGPRGDDALGR